MSNLEEVRTRLDNLRWQDLKAAARNEYGYSPKPSDSKEAIIEECLKRADPTGLEAAAKAVSNSPKPGYVRIRINKVESAGGTEDVLLMVNGYPMTIQRGKVVDIPTKYLNALRDAVNPFALKNNISQDMNCDNQALANPDSWADEDTRFPFDIIHPPVPGPDPKMTNYEKAQNLFFKQRKEAAAKVGLPWLSDKKYEEMLKSGALR